MQQKKLLKTFLLTLCAFALSFGAAIENAEAAINGVLRVPSGTGTNPRYFTDNSGKPIFLAGMYQGFSSQYFESVPLPWSDYVNYTKNTGNLSKFVVRTRYLANNDNLVPTVFSRTGPGNARDGKLKFDLTKVNPVYLADMRAKITDLKNNGIYVTILLFNNFDFVGNQNDLLGNFSYSAYHKDNNMNGLNPDTNNNGWGQEEITTYPFPGSIAAQLESIQKNYIRTIIDNVNDFDNVLFEVCNECHPNSKDWQYWVINYIHEYEKTKPKQHPVGISDLGAEIKGGSYTQAPDEVLFSSPADWISPGGDTWLNNPPAQDGSRKKVVITDTDHIGPVSKPIDIMIPAYWKFFVRGCNPLRYALPYAEVSNPTINHRYENPITDKNIAKIMEYAKGIDLVNASPRNDLATTTFCLAKEGEQYVVFQPTSGAGFTVKNLTSGTYNYEWYNIFTNTVVGSSTITASAGNRSFTPPFSDQAVLYLKKTNPADVNQDTKINIQDIQIVVKVITGTLTNSRADVNGDGVKNIKDIQQIVRAIIGQ